MQDLSYFPEAQWPAAMKKEAYAQQVAKGYENMKQINVAICGLARNVESKLPATIARVNKLGSLFRQYKVVVVENDSTDSTPELLADWAATNSAVHIFSEKFGDPVNPQARCLDRAARMAKYRNIYRDYVAENLSDFAQVVIVVDLDLVGGWSYDGIAHSLGTTTTWSFIGSNGLAFLSVDRKPKRFVQFDVWAFREAKSWRPMNRHKVNPMVFAVGAAPVRVNSCFGGLCVYHAEAFLSGRYEGTDCEHVPFHKQLADAGWNHGYLNPSQLVLY